MNTFRYFWNNYALQRKFRLLIVYTFLFLSIFMLIQHMVSSLINYKHAETYLTEIISFPVSMPFFSTVVSFLFMLSYLDMHINELHMFKILRLASRQQLRNIFISNILLASFLFMIVVFILDFGISISLVGLSAVFFTITTFKWFIINFAFQVLCLFILGLLVTIIGLVTKKLFITIIMPIVLSLIDTFFPISFIFKQATIYVNQAAGSLNLIYTALYLLLVSYV